MKMSRSRVSLKRTLLLSAVVAVSLLSATAMAADTTTPAKTTTPATQKTATTSPKAATSATEKSTPAADSSTPAASTPAKSTAKDTAKDSASAEPASTTPSTTTKGTVAITPTGSQQSSETASIPALTTSGTDSTSKLNLPTLSTTNTGVPTYPAPTVPPTKNAPFMQHSNLPDGTVFIAVGAILGGFAAALLVWRAVVAYLLHRSIARAAQAQHAANDKAAFAAPAAPFYKYSDRESSLNLGAAGAGSVAGSARGVRRTNRGPIPSATPSQTNLFFSPTAPGASGMGAGSNRDSRLLPSGFYAAGSASPAGAAQGQAINMSNLRPDSRHGRNVGPSPPDSPNFGPMRTNLAGRNMSGSSVSLNRPASGRAPSAFLDDLLDDQPHLFPPGTGPSSHNHTYSQSSHGGGRY